MKISYVYTLYNKEQCIAESLDSVFAQEGDFDKEIIIVNDGSTDKSYEIAKAKLDSFDVDSKIITQKNAGPSVALNNGVDMASGEFIYIIDSDDYIYPDATKSLLDIAIRNNFAYVKGKYTRKADDSTLYDNHVEIIANPTKLALDNMTLGCSVCLISRELFLKAEGCDERIFTQDYAVTLKLSKLTDFAVLNNLTAHNIERNQYHLSSNKSQELHDNSLARKLFSDEYELSDEEKIKLLAVQLRDALKYAKNKYGLLSKATSKLIYRYGKLKAMPKSSLKYFEEWVSDVLNIFDQEEIRLIK